VGAGAINVTGLQPGQRYSFRVVAINGVSDITRETRSDPHTVAMNAGIVYAWHAHFLFSWSLTSLDNGSWLRRVAICDDQLAADYYSCSVE